MSIRFTRNGAPIFSRDPSQRGFVQTDPLQVDALSVGTQPALRSNPVPQPAPSPTPAPRRDQNRVDPLERPPVTNSATRELPRQPPQQSIDPLANAVIGGAVANNLTISVPGTGISSGVNAGAGTGAIGAGVGSIGPSAGYGVGSGVGSGAGVGAGVGATPVATPVATPGFLLPAAGVVAGAATGAQQIQGASNAIKGDRLTFAQQAALALPTFGASFLVNPARSFFESKTKVEDKKINSLIDQGIQVANVEPGSKVQLTNKSREEQLDAFLQAGAPEDFAGFHNGQWVNTKWLKSGDEADLKPEDIWGYAAFYEQYGNRWLQEFNEEQRRVIAQTALDKGAVNEGHGTITVDFSKLSEEELNPSVAPVAVEEAKKFIQATSPQPQQRRKRGTPKVAPPTKIENPLVQPDDPSKPPEVVPINEFVQALQNSFTNSVAPFEENPLLRNT